MKYLLAKLPKGEHGIPETQSDDESDSSGVESDNVNDEKESVNESVQSDCDEAVSPAGKGAYASN